MDTFNMQTVDTPMIKAIGYDKSRSMLRVVLRDGTIYEHSGVPESEYVGLMAASSKDCYFLTRIRGGRLRLRKGTVVIAAFPVSFHRLHLFAVKLSIFRWYGKFCGLCVTVERI